MSVLLPLYVYPSAGAWDPLYTAAKTYPTIDFTVVVNPCSGPCLGVLPTKLYVDEIPKLKAYRNIRTLGYVATNYTQKGIDDVITEIDRYANWPKVSNNTKLSVDGIFFDETPSLYEETVYDYLKQAAQSVKNGTRFKDRFVVHNPGSVPVTNVSSQTPGLSNYMNLADITVVFEESFEKWLDIDTFDQLQNLPYRESKTAVILHSVPHIGRSVMDWIIDNLGNTAEWLFVTSVSTKDQYYSSFSPVFDTLLKTIA